MIRRILFCLSVLVVGLSVIQIVWASSDGADPGHSGGHVGGGWNCTACHFFNSGPGGVELLGSPRRYVPGGAYDLTVRVFDTEQIGAGFQISAESATGHQGLFILTDATNTDYAGIQGARDYVTHTRVGYEDSEGTWAANGGSYTYHVHWVAPAADVGAVTFFTAGNAVDGQSISGDHYYATYAVAHPASAADADGDEDVDLIDFAAYQRCFDAEAPAAPPPCEFVDVDVQSFVAAFEGPTAAFPAGYLLADPVRGGLLYDKWWAVIGVSAPAGDHPLYPQVGQQSGSSTFRCKECHGWDYKGAAGAYGPASSHYTGIRGVIGTALSPREMFDLLKADPNEILHGHDMGAYGMTDGDLWNVVGMILDRMILTDIFIDQLGAFRPDPATGAGRFNDGCATCHGFNGTDVNFGTAEAPVYLGGLARGNPWEFLHKTRFGHPVSPMPASDLLLWTALEAAQVGAYSATLP